MLYTVLMMHTAARRSFLSLLFVLACTPLIANAQSYRISLFYPQNLNVQEFDEGEVLQRLSFEMNRAPKGSEFLSFHLARHK